MSNQELCTQYEFIVTMLEKGDTEEVIAILKDAIERIKGTISGKSNKTKKSDD